MKARLLHEVRGYPLECAGKETPIARETPRGRVLIVDDTPVNLQLARWILEPRGYATVLAHDVAEALMVARREPLDLVLSDVHMPGADGFELLAAMQADPALRDVPFAFLSSSSCGGADHHRAIALGAKAFLERPISTKDLLFEVERLIAQARRDRGEPGAG